MPESPVLAGLSGLMRCLAAGHTPLVEQGPVDGVGVMAEVVVLEGVAAVSADSERSLIDVASLITADRKRLLESPKAGPISYRLLELRPMMPRFSVEHVRQRLETTFPTARDAAPQIATGLLKVYIRSEIFTTRWPCATHPTSSPSAT